MSTQIGLEVLKSDLLLRLLDLLIWLLMLAFLKTFSTNRFNGSCVGFFIFFKFVTYCFDSQNLIERNAFFKRIRICGFCVQIFLTVSCFVISVVWSLLFVSLQTRVSTNSILCLENLKSNLMDQCFWFVKFLKFLNASSDVVHIMKISPMNRKKRIDLSLIRELRIEDFFQIFT